MSSPYVELHAHSAYSFLDGTSLPEELAASALDQGYEAFALTDHDGVWGSMEFAHAAKGLGLHAIHGTELMLDDGRHLTLLVRNANGWRSLCRLVTIAHSHTRERPRDPDPPQLSISAVCEHAEGLVCLTGCASRGVHDEDGMRLLRESFGREGLRVELQRPFLAGDRARNRALATLARRLELRCTATGNVHAHLQERAPLQDAFVALRHHLTLESSESVRRGNTTHVLSSPRAMAARFIEHPEAVAETVALAAELNFDLTSDLGYRYPGSEDDQAPRRLAELCSSRLHERYKGNESNEARARLDEELAIIDSLGLSGFFLLHHEMLDLARDVAAEVRGPDSARALLPPGRGRGSSVSSIVCYLTGLSHIDPIANDLAVGRFLSAEIESLPDIDLDFPRDIRHVLIRRVHERYGAGHAALVASFPTFRTRSCIRELGKVLGLPDAEIERAARGADGYGGAIEGDMQAALDKRPGSASGRWQWLAKLSEQAHRLPRHISQHPGGMIIATQPLIDCCPVIPAAMEGRRLVQWDKDSCSDAHFVKIDLLGLGMLSAVERCVDAIARERGKRIDLSRIRFDDPQTFAAIQTAQTTGVFQIESRAQMQSLLRTRPANLEELAIQVAIIRPGPVQGGAVNPYVERRQRLREDPDYEPPCLHPSLKPVLRETLGTIVFQDQVIEVAQAFAGFSASQAHGLRRAMSRKRSKEAIERHRADFVEGAVHSVGAERELAERVWAMVEGFAGFGFPKAHSAAFGLLAYQSTWLQVHYGAEFLCALLNEQPMGFYPPDSLVHEAQRRGIEILGVDINASEALCSIEAGSVRIGLGYVRGVRAEEVETIVNARTAHGPYATAAELAARVPTTRHSLEQLAWSGACDKLPTSAGTNHGRRSALWALGVAASGVRLPNGQGTQLALALDEGALPDLPYLGRWELLLADYATTGVSATDHALAILRRHLSSCVASNELPTVRHGSTITVAGLVVARQRPETAKGVVFVLLEDEHGTINLIVPSAVYEHHRRIVRTEPLVQATGKLERPAAGGGAINILVSSIRTLDPELVGAGQAAQPKKLPSPAQGEANGLVESSVAAAGGVPVSIRAVAPAAQSFGRGRR